MFNLANRTPLSAFAGHGSLVRDCDFFAVGKTVSNVPDRLVPVSTLSHLRSITQDVRGVVCPAALRDDVPDELGCLISEKPLETVFHIHKTLAGRPDYLWTRFDTRIASSARIDPSAVIAPNDVIIGDDVVVEAGAIIGERSLVADGSFIGPGTLIGTPAFELVRIDGRNLLYPQAGGVRIGTGSIFLGGVAVARSVFATFTEIEENCAFDNLVHIAHDCVIGAGSRVTAGAVLAGRVTLTGEGYVGPNATISNGVTIGEGGEASLGSTVIRNVEPGHKVSGNFAIDHAQFMRNLKRSLHKD